LIFASLCIIFLSELTSGLAAGKRLALKEDAMAGIQEKGRAKSLLSLTATALLIAVIVCACQGGGTSSVNKSDLKLSFSVMGIDSATGPSSKSGSPTSKSISPLILSTAATLTVSLTPLDSGLSTPAPQTVSITSGEVATVSFSEVEYGNYTISAVAYDSSGSAQFQQSAKLTVSESTTAATLNLVPSFFDTTTITGSSSSLSLSNMANGEWHGYSVPLSIVSTGGKIPAGYYQLYMSAAYPCIVMAMNADGTLLLSASVMGSNTTILKGTSIFVNSSTVDVGPCSASTPSYIIIVSASSMPNFVSAYFNTVP
jgi:hypothetical protein